jgi:hypothetical protein
MTNPRQEYMDRLESIMREEYLGKIDNIEKKLDKILEKLNSVEKGTDKMSSHIDFIDTTYTSIKMPLFWMCDRVNLLRGIQRPTEVLNSTINSQD